MTIYKGPYPGASAGQDASPKQGPLWERREVKWWHWLVVPLRAYRPWCRPCWMQGFRGRSVPQFKYEYQSDRKRAWEALREAHDPDIVRMTHGEATQAPNHAAGRRPKP